VVRVASRVAAVSRVSAERSQKRAAPRGAALFCAAIATSCCQGRSKRHLS
jgi:hypothetical protein